MTDIVCFYIKTVSMSPKTKIKQMMIIIIIIMIIIIIIVFYANNFHIFSFLETFFLLILGNFLFSILMHNRNISFLKNHFNDFNFFGLLCRKYADIIFDVTLCYVGALRK